MTKSLISFVFPDGKVNNGSFLSLPVCCQQECRKEKCSKFHQQVMNEEGDEFRKCHHGYICRKVFVNGAACALVGMRIKKLSPKHCFDEGGRAICQYSESVVNSLIEFNNRYVSEQIKIEKQNQYLPDLIHSLAKLLDSAATNGYFIAEEMLKTEEERNYQRIGEAAITSGMASIQAKAVLFQANEQIEENSKESPLPVSVYGKFVRASHTLRYLRKNARIDRFGGESKYRYNLTPSFSLVPYLILDNALKYSLKNGSVYVKFVEDSNGLDVSVSNRGPFVQKDLIKKLWENGYRTPNAKAFTSEGSGIGLCTVLSILKANKIEVDVKTWQHEGVQYNNIPLGNFCLTMHIPAYLRCPSSE